MTLTLTRTARQGRKERRRALDNSLARMDALTPGRLDRPSYEQVDLMLISGVPVSREWLLSRLVGVVDL